jgi:phosphate transport system protein
MPEKVTRKSLTEGLGRLNENMVTMAELSELAIRKALGILHLANGKLAADPSEVFTLDHELYGLYRQIETACINLIALHSPVATDLRTITASLEVTLHLDRIGRYAKDIAEAAEVIRGEIPNPTEKFPQMGRMAELTIQMVDTSVRAFVSRDGEPVRNVLKDDDAVDALHAEVLAEIVARITDRSVSAMDGAQFILVNRYLERIADHAVDIGQQTTYLLTGERPARPGGEQWNKFAAHAPSDRETSTPTGPGRPP